MMMKHRMMQTIIPKPNISLVLKRMDMGAIKREAGVVMSEIIKGITDGELKIITRAINRKRAEVEEKYKTVPLKQRKSILETVLTRIYVEIIKCARESGDTFELPRRIDAVPTTIGTDTEFANIAATIRIGSHIRSVDPLVEEILRQ